MYTTKRLNGRLATEGYCSVGSPYGVKEKSPDRAVGKQFLISKIKTNHGYFEPKTVASEPYTLGQGYRLSQPAESRKTGFGSHDARKRDEFSLQIRQDQYKENIEKETRFQATCQKKQEAKAASGDTKEDEETEEEMTEEQQRSADWFQSNVPTTLYDIHNSPNGITPLCNRCKKETFYCIHRVKKKIDEQDVDRRLGGIELSSSSYGGFNHQFRATAPSATTQAQTAEGSFATKSLTPTAKQMSKSRISKPRGLNASAYFMPSTVGRKHTMANFYDNFHLEVSAK
jgi:hypothetical protein